MPRYTFIGIVFENIVHGIGTMRLIIMRAGAGVVLFRKSCLSGETQIRDISVHRLLHPVDPSVYTCIYIPTLYLVHTACSV